MTRQLKRRSIRVDGTWDIECASWDKPVVAVTHHRTEGTAVHATVALATERMLSLGGYWWSHNGGAYDTLAALEVLRDWGVAMQISLSGAKVSRAQGAGLTLCDSYSLIPLGLEVASEIAGVPAPALNWPCDCGQHCGGYCAIRVGMSESMLAQLAEYCICDTVVLMDTLDALCAFAERQDFDLRGTIGGSAWATARRVLGIPDSDMPASTWKRIRSAYYGGRVSVFRPRVIGGGRHWDISSSYPAALSVASLPVGEPMEYGGRNARQYLTARRPGVYACTVSVPESPAPPLPWTWRHGTSYPVGKVSGAWTLPELDLAESRGCVVDDVSWCVIWPGEERVFGELMRAWTDTRFRCGKETALGKWMRLFPNSLPGKFAERPDRRFVKLHPELSAIRTCRAVAPCTRKLCSGACEAWGQIDTWGEMWSVPYYRPATSGHVHWGAYTTAIARAALLGGIESQGGGVVYCDTDSLWTTSHRKPNPTGGGLGDWTLKHTWGDWRCAAPKSYSFVDGRTGELTVRSAGARLHAREWLEGEASQDRGVNSFIDAARESRGLFRAKRHVWTLPRFGMDTGWYGDRLLDADTGCTYPATCETLRKREQARRGQVGPA
jgi:hypothetical protein